MRGVLQWGPFVLLILIVAPALLPTLIDVFAKYAMPRTPRAI